MKTNRLSDTLADALNEQMTKKRMLRKSIYHMPHGLTTMDIVVLQIFFSGMQRKSVTI